MPLWIIPLFQETRQGGNYKPFCIVRKCQSKICLQMSDFTKAVSIPTIVKVFHLQAKPLRDQFQSTEIWLRLLILQFIQPKLSSKGYFTWMRTARLSWTFRCLIWLYLTSFQVFPHSWLLHTTFILCHKYCHQINRGMLYIGQLEKYYHYTWHNVVWRGGAKKTQ